MVRELGRNQRRWFADSDYIRVDGSRRKISKEMVRGLGRYQRKWFAYLEDIKDDGSRARKVSKEKEHLVHKI